MLKNTKEKFGLVAITLHWGIGLLIIGLLALGLYMEDLPKTEEKFWLYGLHKSFGVLALFLMTLRLGWRLANIQPDFVATMKPIEKMIAKAAYLLFYILLFAMPLSGWAMSTASNYPVSFFGLFTLPNIVAPDPGLREFFGKTHELIGWGLMGLIALHVAAALKHHFITKDGTLRKMLPALLLGVFLFSSPAFAAPPVWTVDMAESRIDFTAEQQGAPFDGAFKTFKAEIAFDPDHLDQSHVQAEIDTAGIDTKNSERDRSLAESDWFDSSRFPVALFTSKSFRKLQEGQFEVTGELKIRDVLLPVIFPFTLEFSKNQDGTERALMKASFVLKRLDFNLGGKGFRDVSVIANEVTVALHIVAQHSLVP